MESLIKLRRQHHALLPPYLLNLPPAVDLASEDAQRYIVEHILEDAAIGEFRAERSYERGFWRKIVSELEKGVGQLHEDYPDSEAEVDERIYEALADFMVASPDDGSPLPKQSYRTFMYDVPSWVGSKEGVNKVTLLEEQVAIQAGTTGLRTWTASLHLAHHILRNPQLLGIRPGGTLPACIELGAGTGFLSILLSQLGASVLATDLGDEDGQGEWQTPLARLRGNVALNTRNGELKVEHLDWMDASRKEERPAPWNDLCCEGRARIVVGADIIYDPNLVPPLVAAISILLSHHPGNIAIIAATVRNPSTLALFEQQCALSNLAVTIIPITPMDPLNPTFFDSALDLGSEVRIMRIAKGDNG